MIDTPLGRMDHTHRRNLVERYFPQASHQVILLSTDAEVDQTYQQLLHELGTAIVNDHGHVAWVPHILKALQPCGHVAALLQIDQ